MNQSLTKCETEIMKIVWNNEEDITMPDLIEEINKRYNKDFARTTVVTFAERLEEKGFVKKYRKSNYSYIHAEKSY